MTKRTKKRRRRNNWILQVIALTVCLTTAQVIGIWYIHLAMTNPGNDVRLAAMVLQYMLSICFTVLLILMTIRTIRLSRIVRSTRRTLHEQARQHKFTESALRLSKEQAEAASEAKTKYLAGLSHELRSPMNAIVGFAELLAKESFSDEHLEYINTIQSNSRHLLDLLNNVLDLSKIEAGKFEIVSAPFKLQPFMNQIDRIIRSSAEVKDLRFDVLIDGPIPDQINSDELHLRQCLTNLLTNAIKFTKTGSVTLRVHSVPGGVCFEVSDTGIGIPVDRVNAIFETFTQTNENTHRIFGGTGLGLAITKELIELMGGSITVDSIPGQGSTFALHLPCADPVGTAV